MIHSENKHNKTISFLGAFIIILPLLVIVYEKLASHNGHPSLMKTFMMRENKDKKIPLNKPVISQKVTPKLAKEIEQNKINIKANLPPEKKKVVDKNKATKTPSQQPSAQKSQAKKEKNKEKEKKQASTPKKMVRSVGDNPTGNLDLPSLLLKADWSESFIKSLIQNNLVIIVANGSHFYHVGQNDFWDGRFKVLASLKESCLSIRNTSLTTPSLINKLDTRFQLAMFNGYVNPPSYKLQFSCAFNQQIVKAQLAAQKKSKIPLDKTIFELRIKDGKAVLILK